MLSSLLTQNLLVAAIVLTAAVLLLIRASKYLLPGKSQVGCASGCGGCSNSKNLATSKPQLLQLGEPARRD